MNKTFQNKETSKLYKMFASIIIEPLSVKPGHSKSQMKTDITE